MSPQNKDPTCHVPSCSLCGPWQAISCLGAAGGPDGGWRLHGAHREEGMVSLVVLGLRKLGIHHWSLSRKMSCQMAGKACMTPLGGFVQCSGHWHHSAWLWEFLERSSRQTTDLSLHTAADSVDELACEHKATCTLIAKQGQQGQQGDRTHIGGSVVAWSLVSLSLHGHGRPGCGLLHLRGKSKDCCGREVRYGKW